MSVTMNIVTYLLVVLNGFCYVYSVFLKKVCDNDTIVQRDYQGVNLRKMWTPFLFYN